ncbi:MAG: PD-(D/E)XK nuclease family protein, partial [Chloroflexota bacterium]
VEELAGAVDATRYQPQPASEAILVAPLHQARGVPFRAVALLGLAEGAFPATLTEDPFLRESDRRRLREEHSFPLESSVASEEAEYFYEAIIRPWQKLLLTRPRLAEGGATWEPSPFWEEVKRLLALQPQRVETEEAPRPQAAASTAELLESLCLTEHQGALRWCDDRWPQRWKRVQRAGRLFRNRYDAQETAHDGSLHELSPELQSSFGPASVWSATRLERYLTCPFYFFIGDVLHKEARAEPEVGLDARQLGSIYHRLLEQVFQNTPPHRRNDPHSLDAALDEVAPPLLDRAPHREGFRATAWWKQTRQEIIANVRRSLHEMAQQMDDASTQFQPTHFELRFFGSRALAVEGDNDDRFRLHGVIDRVDIDDQGQVRIIDYKTAGPYRYGAGALRQGRKIQLPLYALAAEKALQLGRVVDGFYWHVQHAERSSLRLGDLGPEEAIQLARDHAWRAVRGVRAGDFRPQPPSEGCPTYCPAAAFCWHYSPPRSW